MTGQEQDSDSRRRNGLSDSLSHTRLRFASMADKVELAPGGPSLKVCVRVGIHASSHEHGTLWVAIVSLAGSRLALWKCAHMNLRHCFTSFLFVTHACRVETAYTCAIVCGHRQTVPLLYGHIVPHSSNDHRELYSPQTRTRLHIAEFLTCSECGGTRGINITMQRHARHRNRLGRFHSLTVSC